MAAPDMDDESYTLIAALLVRAGCLMEDKSVAFVSRLPRDPPKIEAVVRLLNETAADLAALGAAAGAILRGRSQSS